jgi:ribulose-bisphosphate carboxylase large chain
MSDIVFHYEVSCEPGAIQARAESLLLEQTVELARNIVTDAWVRGNIIGRVLSVEQIGEGLFSVAVAQPYSTTAGDPAQFLNVAFGNSSLQPDVALASIDAPEEFHARFKGPRFGIQGLRERLGVQGRALTCTALKPMGLSPEAMAALAFDFAAAGLDLIKDDHGLADHSFCPFEKRVELCQQAVARANAQTGRSAIYVPNLIGGPGRIQRQLAFAKQAGVGAVMLAPLLVGPALLAELAEEAGLPILAHPALGGIARISPLALFGQVFKWFGADAVIYPHLGGRFSYSRQTCQSLAAELRSTGHGQRAAFPVPAGGIKTGRVREVLQFYGIDTVLLVGGSLLETGDVAGRSREFAAEVAAVSQEVAAS